MPLSFLDLIGVQSWTGRFRAWGTLGSSSGPEWCSPFSEGWASKPVLPAPSWLNKDWGQQDACDLGGSGGCQVKFKRRWPRDFIKCTFTSVFTFKNSLWEYTHVGRPEVGYQTQQWEHRRPDWGCGQTPSSRWGRSCLPLWLPPRCPLACPDPLLHPTTFLQPLSLGFLLPRSAQATFTPWTLPPAQPSDLSSSTPSSGLHPPASRTRSQRTRFYIFCIALVRVQFHAALCCNLSNGNASLSGKQFLPANGFPTRTPEPGREQN